MTMVIITIIINQVTCVHDHKLCLHMCRAYGEF